MPKVYNMRHTNGFPTGSVYVGRPSPWGNKYTHLNSTVPGTITVATRDEAVVRHKADVLADVEIQAKIKQELRGKDLYCWCAPKPCHADILLEIANAE